MNVGLEKVKVYFDGGDSPFEKGRVSIEPLERGFGDTIGVALRRILMSTIPGASVIGMKVPGLRHEFGVISGTATDATKFILNLKKVRFGLDDLGENDGEIRIIRFKKNKKGIYYAGDLELPEGVKVQNPEQEIINLTGEKEVDLTLYVKRGKGYIDAKDHDDFNEFEDASDIIRIDGKFSPIGTVGYDIEKVRIGQNPNFERLILTIETDGSIHAKDAAMLAAKIAQSHFNFFENMSDIADKAEIHQEKEEEEKDHILDQPIEMLDLSVRSYNCLKREKYLTIRDVTDLTELELFNINQLGEKSVNEIIDKIHEYGLELKKE